ncbi:hypothetical protein EWM64_g6877 [Hericium alpestre]|uniref:Uncharacterized protein n=1 Tax=Hericium alpestre TaxID=135208 RepID=A0A4Y9ZRC7_9AGAM|nr:hypothetical protein EWM64_g6877 [Hericium alpestre]
MEHFCKALGFLCLTKGEARRASMLEQLFFWNLKSVEVCDVNFLANIAENGLKRPFNEVFMNWLSMREALMDEDDEDFSESGDDGQGSGKRDADSWDGRYMAEDVDHRLERLVITGRSITKECVDQLHGFFKDVILDQSEGIYGEESDDDDEYMY